jgi:hypothetical protein
MFDLLLKKRTSVRLCNAVFYRHSPISENNFKHLPYFVVLFFITLNYLIKRYSFMKQLSLVLLCLGLLFSGSLTAQKVPEAAKADTVQTDDKSAEKKKKGKSYSDVITEEAETDEGLFTVHKVEDKYFFEIPKEVLNKEILVVSRIAGHVKGLNFGGAGMRSRPQQVVRFEHKDNMILLRSVSYDAVANEEDAIALSVKRNNFEPVIEALKIETFNEYCTAMVINVGSLFTSDVEMIGPLRQSERKRFGVRRLDSGRSFINYMKAFPENVEVRHVLTFDGNQLPDNQVTNTLSIEMNQSFILLPEEPMMPRYQDDRVDYFDINMIDYSADAHKAQEKTFITRWRLEPKDEAAYKRGELVEPIKPIVYYIDPGTPEVWRPYIKQGIEDWQTAFEKAGFKNAIIAKDPPSPEEDPDWSPEDVRYSVVRYVSTDIQNAMGPHVHDPRTGEILESDIIWYHNVMNLLRNWFLIQTAAVNPAAQMVKFEDELMGELIRFVAAHEVGHTLGLPHNMGSSVAYPVDSLRSPGFVQKYGVAPSIMDYARFNYVAQPEDKGAGLMPKIGPYDDWSIIYGYKYTGMTTDEEEAMLNSWIEERADDPIYRFGQQQGRVTDPSAQTEDVGSDAVEASDLGVKNLQRIVPQLIEWAEEDGKDFGQLAELYANVVGQFRRYIGHVGNNVGGIYEYDKTFGQEGAVYTHVPKEKQRAAVNFMNRQVFQTPNWLIEEATISRVNTTVTSNMLRLQGYAMNILFDDDRLKRVMENEAINGSGAYTMKNLFDDTRRGVFAEAYAGAATDIYRRNLQRAYVDKLAELMSLSRSAYDQSDIQAMARATLNRLEEDLEKAAKKQDDDITEAHFIDLLARIDMIQEGKMPAGNSSNGRAFQFTEGEENGCWYDDSHIFLNDHQY